MNLELFARKIKDATNIVVLTGAGISTASGIPDFRSSTGLYSKYPDDILSDWSFKGNPDRFYEAFQEKFSAIYSAKPNRAHEILAEWEAQGKVLGIITQNVDGLHQQAGSKNVIEYHGTIWKYSKVDVSEDFNRVWIEDPNSDEGYILDALDYNEIVDEKGIINYRKDGFLYKPEVVLFGEPVRDDDKARLMIKQADLILVLGTQLQVKPFARLPKLKKSGVPVLVINKTEIEEYIYGKLQLYSDIAETLIKIQDKIRD